MRYYYYLISHRLVLGSQLINSTKRLFQFLGFLKYSRQIEAYSKSSAILIFTFQKRISVPSCDRNIGIKILSSYKLAKRCK
jgi:hypothetical protein